MKDCIIEIPQGTLRGADFGAYRQFYDVPYAEDRGRFREAGAAPCWDGVRDAVLPGPVFPQASGRLAFVMGNTAEEKNQSESAFSVNIWTPPAEGPHLVLFWMHGGAFMTGGGAIPWYSGAALAEKAGIVVVNVSYRLGVLGNLYLPGLTEGNLSVTDVNKALRWVHENIAYFGGDSDNITIAGQSAGAWYCVLMMGNPQLRGLFRRAGLFSFNGGTAPYLPAEADRMTSVLLEKLGITAEKLLTKDVSDILAAQKIPVSQPERLNIPFLPVIDSETVFTDYIRQSAVVSDPSVEVFCGTVAHESTPFVAAREGETEEEYLSRVEVNTKAAFLNDTELLLQYLRNAGHPVYRYEFAYESAMEHVHACHCFDIPFLLRNFSQWAGAPFLEGIDMEQAERVSEEYSGAFVRFTRDGEPGRGWKPYDGMKETAVRLA
ncbi:MAG: carboxylesterase family protein [Clostridium sp.]|nr:carboxylesterase family protein [Clostridium sp.]